MAYRKQHAGQTSKLPQASGIGGIRHGGNQSVFGGGFGTSGKPTSKSAPAPTGWVAYTFCSLCWREARGFGYQHPQSNDAKRYFCSMGCLNAWSSIAVRNMGVVDMTDMEKQAIKDARRFFAEALTELGLMDHFANRTAADIDQLITAAVDGFQKSMMRQSMNDVVPL